MYAKRKVTGTAMGIPVGLGLGAAASLLITFAGAALTAWLIVSEKIGEAGVILIAQSLPMRIFKIY